MSNISSILPLSLHLSSYVAHLQGFWKMNPRTSSPTYYHPSCDANIINISEDSDDETTIVQPKVELPASPLCDPSKTFGLLNQINTLDSQLTAIRFKNQHKVAYYQQRIENLKGNSSHAFKYISEIQAYIEKKISTLEIKLYYTQANLQKAQ